VPVKLAESRELFSLDSLTAMTVVPQQKPRGNGNGNGKRNGNGSGGR
jgi:hypothetical protein